MVNGVMHAGTVSLTAIAEAVGTPSYVYSAPDIATQFQQLTTDLKGLNHRICYAVKANSNLSVLRSIAELGASFDIVSGGELQRVVSSGADPRSVVFSGVGKTTEEIDFALKLEVGCFNVESTSELTRLGVRAALFDRVAPVAVRVNPDVDAETHPYISTGLKENKFGVPSTDALALYMTAQTHPNLRVSGVACHIGSQILSIEPFSDALDGLLRLVDELDAKGIGVAHVDVGGGLGVAYQDETALDTAAYGAMLRSKMAGRSQTIVIEPGRYLVANAGLLLTRVEYLKPAKAPGCKSFAVVDAAMNDLLRPSLYQAWHAVERVIEASNDAAACVWDIVGPVCESGDFIAHERTLSLAEGDLLAIRSAGAYGMVQSSNYNSRGRAAEVLVDDEGFRVVRSRENINDQMDLEQIGLRP
ncbi:MAG: diaminopimelate decarboxylase [Gammaproteobacteria bacterium]|nr:diaminopimelate decarboxylase [Gammaproteobacteria bacterium]